MSAPPTFHAFTTKYEGLALAIVTPVRICAAFDPQNPPTPAPTYLEFRALWDTGATNSLITAQTARTLNLVPTGSGIVNHAGGSDTRPKYLVNMMLPNNVGVVGVQVMECSGVPGGFEAIIGMDIITNGDFSITNCEGKTCMSFRTPSVKEVDYVVEANKLRGSVVSRNAPCPCGSGKKFKRCCGKTTA